MSDSLPRGITIHKWRNPATKTRSLRYRVRVKRKDPHSPMGYYIFDKSFETLDEAKEALASTKTRDGRLGLTEREERAEIAAEVAKAMILRPNLRAFMKDYIKTYIKPKATGHPVKDRSAKVNQARLEHLLEIELERPAPNATGYAVMIPGARGAIRKPLGDFQLPEITAATATALIRERLKNCSPSTVHREITAMATFWRKLKFIDAKTFESLRLNGNPFEEADKSLLKGWNRKRRRILGEGAEEEALFNVLASRRKPEILQIVALALATGMRRGEVLLLRWEQLGEGFIHLEADDTKAEDERFVILTPEARAIIDSVERKPKQERLFSLSIEGMKTAWQRAKKDAGCPDLRFHDLRRSFISRSLSRLQSPVAVAEAMGVQSVGHLERAFIKPLKAIESAKKGRIENDEELRQSVGHADSRITSRYFVGVSGPTKIKAKVETD